MDDGHGRLETREAWVVDDTDWLGKSLLARWPGLATGSLMLVRRTRQDLTDLTGKVTVEDLCYISSVAGHDDAAAQRLAGLARGRWAVENNLHWQLDVSFDEDRRRVRVGHGAENFSRLCRIALNLLKQNTTVKAGIKTSGSAPDGTTTTYSDSSAGEDAIALHHVRFCWSPHCHARPPGVNSLP